MTKVSKREIKLRENLISMKDYDNSLREGCSSLIIGVDEVGRGPLAGPVLAAAVVLPEDIDLLGIGDSKKLSEKKREELCPLIIKSALGWGIGIINSEEIDIINIREATRKAMEEAVSKCKEQLKKKFIDKEIIVAVDGNMSINIDDIQKTVVSGDSLSLSIGAASIVAKVTRDKLMREYDEIYKGYDLAKNKGYGTKAHYQGLENLGLTPIHRKSFLKKLFLGGDK